MATVRPVVVSGKQGGEEGDTGTECNPKMSDGAGAECTKEN